MTVRGVGVEHEPVYTFNYKIVQAEGRHGNLQKLSETNHW